MKKITRIGKTKLVVIALLFALILSCFVGILAGNHGAHVSASADMSADTVATDNETEEEDWSPAINPITYSEVSAGFHRGTGFNASLGTFGAINSSLSSAYINGNVAYANKVRESDSQKKYYGQTYLTFKAETTIPAYTEYTIAYNFTL